MSPLGAVDDLSPPPPPLCSSSCRRGAWSVHSPTVYVHNWLCGLAGYCTLGRGLMKARHMQRPKDTLHCLLIDLVCLLSDPYVPGDSCDMQHRIKNPR